MGTLSDLEQRVAAYRITITNTATFEFGNHARRSSTSNCFGRPVLLVVRR
jgi:hypothetical protein